MRADSHRWPAAALLATTAIAGGRDDLAAFTKGLKGLDGQFTQQVFDANGKRKEASSGTRRAVARRASSAGNTPSRIEQLIVADGETRLDLRPGPASRSPCARRASRRRARRSAALIDRDARWTRDFDAQGAPATPTAWTGSNCARRKRRRTPASSACASASTATAWRAMELVDRSASAPCCASRSWKRNPAFAGGTFRFTPPKGADVVGGQLSAATRGVAATPRSDAGMRFANPDLLSVDRDALRPLAERLRPRTLDEVVGQRHLLGARARRCAARSSPASCIR